jgi:MFS family permease
MFAVALALYGIASLGGGLAPSPGLLVVSRAIQGLGGALLLPATLSLINTAFEEGPARSRALAVWGGAGGLGLALGSLLGGVLTSTFGWESVLFVNVPLAVVAILGALVLLPTDPRTDRRGGFDLPGALTATGGSTMLVFALVQGPEAGWKSPSVMAALVASAALLGIFLAHEARAATPLMPLSLLANRSLSAAMVITFIFMGTFGAQYYILTVYLQDLHNFDALATGLAFLPGGLMALAGTKVSEQILNLTGTRNTLLTGLALGSAGMIAFSLGVSSQGGYAGLLPGIIMVGLGQGIAWTAMFVAASTGVAAERQGIASAMASTTQQIGGAVGLAIFVAIINDSVEGEATAQGLRTADWLAAAITLLGAAVALSLRIARQGPPPRMGKPAVVRKTGPRYQRTGGWRNRSTDGTGAA